MTIQQRAKVIFWTTGAVFCVALLVIQEGRLLAGAPATQYLVSADTVQDLQTTLEWQRSVPGEAFTWAKALEYCEGLDLGGHTDWRLPNLSELGSIVNVARKNPAIDTVAFPNTSDDCFWSSSPYAAISNSAWLVSFYDGASEVFNKTIPSSVRCVR